MSCPVAALGSIVSEKNALENIYKELAKCMEEANIAGLQLYPAGWPRKLQISVRSKDLKNRIIIEGLDLFGSHIDFRDDDSVITKVVVKDAPMDWDDDFMIELMSQYGDVIRAEKEMLYVEGKRTDCTTGTRFIFISKLSIVIPSKIDVRLGVKSFQLSVWYRGQSMTQNSVKNHCTQCGSETHETKACTHANKVCFTCHQADHAHKDCPQNNGTKRSEKALVFYNAKCPLSNWNIEYPFRINNKEYICVEQYAMEEKCNLFGDLNTAAKVMTETNPKNMRMLGDNVRNYNHKDWIEAEYGVVTQIRKRDR